MTILPLISMRPGRRVYPTEVFLGNDATGLSKDSLAVAHQIRTISRDRLGDECGRLEDIELREKIRIAIEKHLGFI